MPVSLASPVSVPGIDRCSDEGEDVWRSGEQQSVDVVVTKSGDLKVCCKYLSDCKSGEM